jgi:hypothetical protein
MSAIRVELPEGLLAEVSSLVARRGISESAWVEEAVREKLAAEAQLGEEIVVEPMADLRLHFVRRGEKRKSPLHVTVGVPKPDGEDWYCPMRIKGLDNMERRIFGVDSWQALSLALRLVEAMLQQEVREGGQLFYMGEKTSISKLFHKRGSR